MARREHPFSNAFSSWMWWAWIDQWGRAVCKKGSKYQQERWHLRALHDRSSIDGLASQMSWTLGQRHNTPVKVRVGSVWVDHTPQAVAKFKGASGGMRKVQCELADLLIVTHASYRGQPARPGDTKALLIQAKVADQLAILDTISGPNSSSAKERNLLECCASDVELWRGTSGQGATGKKGAAAAKPGRKTNSSLGTFALGASASARGLAKFARYLTIPRKPLLVDACAYQTLWPRTRGHNDGLFISLGDTVTAMLEPRGSNPGIGYPIGDPLDKTDWTRMVEALTDHYHTKIIKRFETQVGSAIPRVVESNVYEHASALLARSALPAMTFAKTNARPAVDWFDERQDHRFAGSERIGPRDIEGDDQGPAISVIVVYVTLDSIGD